MLQLDTHTAEYDLILYKERALIGDDWMANYMSFESGRLLSLNYIPQLSDYRYNLVRACGTHEYYNQGLCSLCEHGTGSFAFQMDYCVSCDDMIEYSESDYMLHVAEQLC